MSNRSDELLNVGTVRTLMIKLGSIYSMSYKSDSSKSLKAMLNQ
jgi:hypothetical protein